MFATIRHKRDLKRIERERELKQATCTHVWHEYGEKYKYYNAGTSVDVDTYYVNKCVLCEITKRYKSREIARLDVKLSHEMYERSVINGEESNAL